MGAKNTTTIYTALQELGLKKGQVKALLPEWWDDNIANSDAGLWELVTLIGRRLSLDASSLLDGRIRTIGAASKPSFKHRASLEDGAYHASALIAGALARAVLAATRTPFSLEPMSALQLRKAISEKKSNGLVDFNSLLTFCWDVGIPVVPLPNLPVGIRKMDGAVMQIDGRPAIVIARKNDSRAWLSFILAHELGHYCAGHLKAAASIIDVALKSEATFEAESSSDQQEREANEFALDLLSGGEADSVVSAWGQRLSGVAIAAKARNASAHLKTASGHLVLRYAFLTRRWPEAQDALKFLDEDFDAQSALVDELRGRIDLSLVAEDMRDLVASVTGVATR